MTPETAIAERFRDGLVAELQGQVSSEPLLAPFIGDMREIDCTASRSFGERSPPQTVSRYLEPALAALHCSPALAAAIRDLATVVKWYQVFEGEGIDQTLANGLIAGQMAGGMGIVPSSSRLAGLFLLAPHIYYPLHQHAALEFYFSVSGTLTLQHGRNGTPFAVPPGQLSVTPCNRLHALGTGAQPCLLIYGWTGAVNAPNWWWEQADDRSWRRVGWQRQPDASWVRKVIEPVTGEMLREAGER